MSSTTSIDVPGSAWAEAWQQSWDAQQTGFLFFDREQVLLGAARPLRRGGRGPTPTVVDLACGTASITCRLLTRLPGVWLWRSTSTPCCSPSPEARSARTSGCASSRQTCATLAWAEALGGIEVDAVVTSTALHWLPEADLARLYRDLHSVVRPGGLVANADTMPADGLPRLNVGLTALAQRRAVAALAGGIEAGMHGGAGRQRTAPRAVPMAERSGLFGGSAHPPSFSPPVGWHMDALGAAGFSEVGVAWCSGTDAVVAALR